ncbi:MAG: electron transfer flavoprotein subunit beta/FixA family protein [Victivallales bacterium]|nr:electron transfer flavoprotein subunit beta/FixA family protein [Victivallales bacterium]
MKIGVCLKQVPGTTKVEVDPQTGVLKRDGVDAKLNPFDLYALETALRMKATVPDTSVCAVTMGPPQSEEIIREAYMTGADDGVILSDRRFAGSDVLATSWTLSQGLTLVGPFDLIICGKQTTDGDTAQVGAELAEFLGIPHLCNVTAIEELNEEFLTAVMDLPGHVQRVKVKLPCLITVEKGIFEPRLPSFRRKLATADRPIRRIGLDELPDREARHYGLDGSPTQVARIFPPESNQVRETWTGSGRELADRAFAWLKEHKFLQQEG